MFTALAMVSVALFAPPPCTPPAPSNQCVAWQQVGRDYDVIVKEWTSSIKRTTRQGPWCVSQPCYCEWYPCGERPHNCNHTECNYSVTDQTCWTVSLTTTTTHGGQVGLDLVVRLLGTLQVANAFNGQLQYCYAYTQGVAITPHLSDCWTHKARDVWTEARVYGYTDVALVADYWECQFTNGMVFHVRTECGVTTWAKGDAMNVEEITVQHTPYPCGAGGIPPGWTGPYNEPCCTEPALPSPCDGNLPPGWQPCCGCYGSQ